VPTSIQLFDGDRVMFTGDSTSDPSTGHEWYDLASTGFVASVNAKFSPRPAKVYAAVCSGVAATVTGTAATHVPVPLPGAITVIGAGRGGTTIANLQSDIANELAVNIPAVVFISIGTNDVSNSTPTATFRASYDATLATINGWNGGRTRVVCMSVYAQNESWLAGPPVAWNNARDSLVDGINAQIQASAAAAGAVYVDTRSQLLLWEVVNNPGQAATGFALLADGIHLSAPAGKQQIGNYALEQVAVVP